ncbi:hypothetical protein WS70_23125 [Burkholderia mayonis]|uniref:Uncharacterized protein n=1 Tax=Burkholderia mayonis TaxID=1385591 RepID=A0A1B4FLY0_9BURK|nr:hypothetical protein WS70_23125 [Burkholderia mayonis]KVE42128.1 hypothetical protein WS70_12670 [Burkholderia mayonis]
MRAVRSPYAAPSAGATERLAEAVCNARCRDAGTIRCRDARRKPLTIHGRREMRSHRSRRALSRVGGGRAMPA